MVIRIEVKIDGRVVRVEEEEILTENRTSKIWNFLYRGQEMLEKLSVADLVN